MKSVFSLLAAHLAVFVVIVGTWDVAYAHCDTEGEDRRPLAELSRFVITATTPAGMQVSELSALAWDADEHLLYALSDKGSVFHFRLKLEGNKILSIDAVYAARLATTENIESPYSGVDAEGLTLLNADNGRPGDTELVVVTEGQQRFIHFSPTGALLREVPVPSPLDSPLRYQGANKGLEAVAHHPEHGLLTAPELPLKGAPAEVHTIYASQRQWSFPRYSSAARLKAIAALSDGNLMVLERTRLRSPKLLIPSLRYVNLRDCSPGEVCGAVEKVVLPEGAENFEGLTQIKDHQFLIVSDHSDKDGQGSAFLLITIH